MKITKKQVLDNLDQTKDYIQEIENVKETKKVGITIKNRFTGDIMFESEKITYKEVLEELVNSDANLRDANLCGANLRDANLCDANLYGADLRGANLYGADLRDADLCGANLYGADLRDADLCGANLYGADLRDADLCGAKFIGKTNNPKELTKKQLPNFLKALGFVIKN